MRYPDDAWKLSASGSTEDFSDVFIPWQPSTWPESHEDFPSILEAIFQRTINEEIGNVIDDAQKVTGSLEHRGHVVALSMFCAIDTVSSYGYAGNENDKCETCGRGDRVGPRYRKYIEDYFPEPYKQHAERLYKLYRNCIVHSWNLFEVGIFPGNEPLDTAGDTINFGLLNFFAALTESTSNFITAFSANSNIRDACLVRYEYLRSSAKK